MGTIRSFYEYTEVEIFKIRRLSNPTISMTKDDGRHDLVAIKVYKAEKNDYLEKVVSWKWHNPDYQNGISTTATERSL